MDFKKILRVFDVFLSSHIKNKRKKPNLIIAGNLIGSQMYKIGEPCSSCPSGTSCSKEYPGLCSGTPDKPLKIRRPFPLPKELLALRPSSGQVIPEPPKPVRCIPKNIQF